MPEWIKVCDMDDIDLEDVIGFDYDGFSYAIYRSLENEIFATAALCTHERVNLTDGLVIDDVIECPKHNGRFNFKTGEAKGAPVCVNLETFQVKVECDIVYLLRAT